jgi:hypothetical protein
LFDCKTSSSEKVICFWHFCMALLINAQDVKMACFPHQYTILAGRLSHAQCGMSGAHDWQYAAVGA